MNQEALKSHPKGDERAERQGRGDRGENPQKRTIVKGQTAQVSLILTWRTEEWQTSFLSSELPFRGTGSRRFRGFRKFDLSLFFFFARALCDLWCTTYMVRVSAVLARVDTY